jgi:long-subunit fatty acid transport protein
LLYILPVDEKLTLTPSVSLNMQQFDQGENKNREDMTYTAGLNASYLITQWMNVSAAANYTWKRTNDVGRKLDSPPQEFENFIGGVTLGFNYSF